MLAIDGDKAHCQSCRRELKIRPEGILQFVIASELDVPTAQELTGNFLIRLLARYGIAQRQEYSGVIPVRLELPRLKEMCRKYHYRLALKTHWAFTRDYYRKIFGSSMRFQNLFFPLLNGISALTGIVNFGNFSIVHLHKPNAVHAAGSNRPG